LIQKQELEYDVAISKHTIDYIILLCKELTVTSLHIICCNSAKKICTIIVLADWP